jgi:hypothetical protein
MKIYRLLLFGLMQCSAALLWPQTPGSAGAPSTRASSTQQAKKTGTPPATQDGGEKKFQQNCGRCHNAPETLPRSITGTVLMHMRVRASLSPEAERMILQYMAP